MLTIRRNAMLGVLVAAAHSILPCAVVIGADELTCSIYARTSQSQAASNDALRCGETGDDWASSFSHHYNWCRSASAKSVDEKLTSRGRALNKCEADRGQKTTKQRICDQYAFVSILHHHQSRASGCWLSGSLWSSSYSSHYDWCLNASSQDLNDEVRERERLLTQCLQNPPTPLQIQPSIGFPPIVAPSPGGSPPGNTDWPGPRLDSQQ
jgi:hypothetical protein